MKKLIININELTFCFCFLVAAFFAILFPQEQKWKNNYESISPENLVLWSRHAKKVKSFDFPGCWNSLLWKITWFNLQSLSWRLITWGRFLKKIINFFVASESWQAKNTEKAVNINRPRFSKSWYSKISNLTFYIKASIDSSHMRRNFRLKKKLICSFLSVGNPDIVETVKNAASFDLSRYSNSFFRHNYWLDIYLQEINFHIFFVK